MQLGPSFWGKPTCMSLAYHHLDSTCTMGYHATPMIPTALRGGHPQAVLQWSLLVSAHLQSVSPPPLPHDNTSERRGLRDQHARGGRESIRGKKFWVMGGEGGWLGLQRGKECCSISHAQPGTGTTVCDSNMHTQTLAMPYTFHSCVSQGHSTVPR